MVMLDCDAMSSSKSLECTLRFDGVSRVHLCHQVHVGEIREVIDKDRGAHVSLFGGFVAASGYTFRSRADQLVDAHDFARCTARSDVFSTSFVANGSSMGFSVGTSWACRGRYIC